MHIFFLFFSPQRFFFFSECHTSLLLLLGSTVQRVQISPSIHHSNQLEKGLVHIDVVLCRGLNEARLASLRHVVALFLAHHALLLQIHLVSDQHDGDVLRVLLDAKNLHAQFVSSLERNAARDRIGENEALTSLHVLQAKEKENEK